MNNRKFERLVKKSLVDWEPDIDFERRKCNMTAEEASKFITDNYGDLLKRLSKA